MQWSIRPFVRIVIFYIIGILSARFFDDSDIGIAFLIFICCLLLISVFVIAKWYSSYKYSWLAGVFFCSVIFISGIFNQQLNHKQPYSFLEINKAKLFVGEVVDDPVQTAKSIRVELMVEEYDINEFGLSRSGALVYLEKSSDSQELKYGDKIVFDGRLKLIKNAANPEEFDYAGFLARKEIFYTCYLRNNQWKYLVHSPTNTLMAFAKSLRQNLLRKLETISVFDNTFEVSSAILLGYDILMDSETENNFVRAGAMHILCVSGLHVGVIFMILSFLLNFMKTSLIGKLSRIILLIVSVWFYALIAGLSPSVIRASVMISFFIIGEGFSRLKDSYNTLAASAFVMLWIEPALIYSVGFQLSYAAVFGIISLHRPIYTLFYFKNKYADYFWSIMSVSFAAQIATFPIATHYFHFFPTYFWMVNLLIIPLSFAIIISGFVFFILSWIPYLDIILGYILSFLVFVLNTLVEWVKLLPYNGLDNIDMPWFKLILVYLLIISLFQLVLLKRIKSFKYVLSMVIILLAFNLMVDYNNLNRNNLTIFNVNNHDVIEILGRDDNILIADSSFLKDDKMRSFILNAIHIKFGIDELTDIDISLFNFHQSSSTLVDGSFIALNGKRYFMYNSSDSLHFSETNHKIDIDAVIIMGNSPLNIHKLAKCMDFKKIIISSSVPYWRAQNILKDCNGAGIECYNIKTVGALQENI